MKATHFLASLSICLFLFACGKDDAPVDNSQKGELIWTEDFNITEVDTSKWTYQNGGWTGSMVENCYTPDNVTISDGNLVITARYEPDYQCFNNTKDFTSGFIQTKGKLNLTYGYVEARIKLPESNSTWPAFWMSPETATYGAWPSSGEIDIMEAKGHDLSSTQGNAHWGNSTTDKQQDKGIIEHDASDWQVYAVRWSVGKLEFLLNDEVYHIIENFDAPNATTHPGPFNIPYYIRLNLAVGGTFLTSPYNEAINGIDQLPASMLVDWVRVYE